MRPDQMPRQPSEPEATECEAMMTNAELADAIAYAFQCCDKGYTGGYQTSTTEAGKTMLAHLKELTAVQARRAALFTVPPNT